MRESGRMKFVSLFITAALAMSMPMAVSAQGADN